MKSEDPPGVGSYPQTFQPSERNCAKDAAEGVHSPSDLIGPPDEEGKHRHDTDHAAEVGRRVLGFQALWQVASFFSYLMALLLQAVMFYYFGVMVKGVFLTVFGLTYLVNVMTVVYNQWRLRQGRLDIYPVRL